MRKRGRSEKRSSGKESSVEHILSRILFWKADFWAALFRILTGNLPERGNALDQSRTAAYRLLLPGHRGPESSATYPKRLPGLFENLVLNRISVNTCFVYKGNSDFCTQS